MLYDKDIREPLFDFFDQMYVPNRIIEEKQMGRSRADVVLVTRKAIYGVEIKSDADTYSRLKRQVRDYNLFYDYNYIVVGTKHAYHVKEHIPDWWGIITVEMENKTPDFYMLRNPKRNPKVKWKRKLSMLWRPELAHIQEINGMPKYKQKSKDFVIDKIMEKIPEEILQFQICEELLQRDYNEISKVIEEYKRRK